MLHFETDEDLFCSLLPVDLVVRFAVGFVLK
jgi:hypothetical protein